MTVENELVQKVAACTATELEVNELLKQFHRGYPIENLRLLLDSDEDEVTRNAVWIASELGERAKPCLSRITELLRHPVAYIRFFAIDSVLTCAGTEDGSSVASVLLLCEDEEYSVRSKTVDFLARASLDQLVSALTHLKRNHAQSHHARCLAAFIRGCSSTYEQIMDMLGSEDFLERMYGVAAAARVVAVAPEPLEHACRSSCSRVQRIASDIQEYQNRRKVRRDR